MRAVKSWFNIHIRRTSASLTATRVSPAHHPNGHKNRGPLCNCDGQIELRECSQSDRCQYRVNQVPVFIRTYGCQMNTNDTSIVSSILEDYGYTIVDQDYKAEIELLMTCAIRESAESKIWAKLSQLKKRKEDPADSLNQVGLLGCMAERLKERVLSAAGSVDIVAGPDAYRDLPRLFAINRLTNEKAVNCLLSFDETYSDVRPVTNLGDVSSFISITRGCDNLCSYCIVPFTRGRERSRPLMTILDEIRALMQRGIREVTLLGQNVNSYRDLTTNPAHISRANLCEHVNMKEQTASGFKTVYKPRPKGLTFDVLLEEVAKINPELRIRFTSPHPKDFTNEVIDVIRRYPNISRCIHLPAQSGSDKVLRSMRRGYTKEAYLGLVHRMREAIPNLSLTSDFITGFCGETAEDHDETIDLIKRVKYNYIFSFPYSMRDKTHAYHKLTDDVDLATKLARSQEIIALFRAQADELNNQLVGSTQLVLIDSNSRRSENDWQGRVDTNIKTIVPKEEVYDRISGTTRAIKPGDYVICQIQEANSQTLKARPIEISTQFDYHHRDHVKN